MTAAQRERIAADFVVAFINKGKIKTPKESARAFQRIYDSLVPAKAPAAKAKTTGKAAATRKAPATRKKTTT